MTTTSGMTVLVLGSGAREHALVRTLALDPTVGAVVAAPGNPGMRTPHQHNMNQPAAAPVRREPVDPLDGEAVATLARRVEADLVVIGPEAPLVTGVADHVRQAGVACFGPSAQAARLEGSKAFAKEVMAAAGVPTGRSYLCHSEEEAGAALDAFGPPFVVKDDGLAAGKGVVVTTDRLVAVAHAGRCLRSDGAGRVVVEEYLDGPEVSVFCICDGSTVLAMEPAQDYKRIGDGGTGPNTGGMGAYSPLPWAPRNLVAQVVDRVAQPVIDEMARRGTPFSGLLYCGLVLTDRGMRVIEFNARFGDPETQVVLARMVSSLAPLLAAAAHGALGQVEPIRWTRDAAVTVVLASPGYPDAPEIGGILTGIDDAQTRPGVHVLHAGTALDEGTGELRSAGGRVVSVVAVGEDLCAARAAAYDGIGRISLPGGQFRSDIAARSHLDATAS